MTARTCQRCAVPGAELEHGSGEWLCDRCAQVRPSFSGPTLSLRSQAGARVARWCSGTTGSPLSPPDSSLTPSLSVFSEQAWSWP